MFFAAKTGNLKVVQQLISRVASVELKDKVMYTPGCADLLCVLYIVIVCLADLLFLW